MENIKSFSSFINESKIQEKTGISQVVYGDLKSYFEKCKKDDCNPNLKDAQAYVVSKGNSLNSFGRFKFPMLFFL